ncbi:MAG: hypothetical protein H7334_07595 [Ferruginibacter sp.]|nr:hypothetical protein [Ferruginibacter sp.]
MEFNVYENLKSKKILQKVDLIEALDLIKNERENTPLIKAFRETGALGSFFKTRKEGIATIRWNTPCETKAEGNTKPVDGFIYFNKDGLTKIEIRDYKELLTSLTYVVTAWESLGGKGICCLVKTTPFKEEQYELVWHRINEEIGLEFEEAFRSIEQRNILSYDPGIVYNANATQFPWQTTPALEAIQVQGFSSIIVDSSTFSNSELVKRLKVQFDLLYPKECVHIAPSDYNYSASPIRYETEFHNHIFGDDEYKIFPKGVQYLKMNTYFKVQEEKRFATMFCQASLLLTLNPELDRRCLTDALFQANLYQCKPILPYTEVRNILHEQYNKMQEGRLKVKFSIRKVIYKKNANLTVLEKRIINGFAAAKFKIDGTLTEIANVIARLMKGEKKILQKHVIAKCEKSERTIKSYWKQFVEEVNAYNRLLS